MFTETAILLCVIILLFYKWKEEKTKYFVDRNVKYDKFVPFLGTFKEIATKKLSILDMIRNLYTKFDGEQ